MKFRTRITGFFTEFRDFAFKGNAFDLAIGVIIGAAFNSIVSSLVKDLFTPILTSAYGFIVSLFVGAGANPQAILEQQQKIVDKYIPNFNFLNFWNAFINFIIVALCIFLIIKLMKKVTSIRKKKEAETPAAVDDPDPQLVLLAEIRDLLRAQAGVGLAAAQTDPPEEPAE